MAGAATKTKDTKKGNGNGGNGPNLTIAETRAKKAARVLGDGEGSLGKLLVDYITERASAREKTNNRLTGLETGSVTTLQTAERAETTADRVRDTVEGMETKLSGVETTVSGLETTVGEASDAVSALNKAVIESTKEAVGSVVEEAEIEDKDAPGKMQALFSGLARHAKRLTDAVSSRVESLETSLSFAADVAVEAEILEEGDVKGKSAGERAKALLGNVVGTVQSLCEDLESNTESLNSIRAAFKVSAPKISNPREDEDVGEEDPSAFAAYVAKALKALYWQVMDLRENLPSSEQMDELQRKYEGVEVLTEGYNQDNAEIRDRQAELEQKMESLEQRLEAALNKLDETNANLDGILDHLEAVEE